MANKKDVLLGVGGNFYRITIEDLQKDEISPEDLEQVTGGLTTLTSTSSLDLGTISTQRLPFPNDLVAGVRG